MAERAHLPQQVPIEAYGNGGFRFGGMSHKGSILCLPTGIWDWAVTSIEGVDRAALADVLALGGQISLLFLGVGRHPARPSADVRAAFEEAGIWLEAPEPVLLERVHARRGDASDADAEVVRAQLRQQTGPIAWERVEASERPDVVEARARERIESLL